MLAKMCTFMNEAYVLINVKSGLESTVLSQIKSMVDVEQASISYGAYDLVVKVKADSMEELKEIVTYKIRKIDGVQSTLTLPIA